MLKNLFRLGITCSVAVVALTSCENQDFTSYNVDVKRIDDKTQIASNVTFYGFANGTVEPANASGAKALPIESKNATLTFNAANGEEHLTANFDNWYKLDVKKNGMGQVTWVNTDDCGRRIPTEYVVKDTPLAGGAQNESVYFNTEFYGDDNIPAEAVALFQYQQKSLRN